MEPLQARRGRAGRRSVSEIFSAILLIALVAVIGTGIYLTAVSHVLSTEQDLLTRLGEERAEVLGQPVVLHAYAYNSTGELWVIVMTGPLEVKVYGAYMGGAPLEPEGFPLPQTLPPDSTVKLGPFNATQPLGEGQLTLTLATSAGRVTAPVDLLP